MDRHALGNIPVLKPDDASMAQGGVGDELGSPMIQISEAFEEGDDNNKLNSPALAESLPPLSSAKKRSSAYMTPLQQPIEAFQDLQMPSGANTPGNRSSVSSLKYVPSPSVPMRSRSPPRTRSPQRTRSPTRVSTSPVRSRSTSPHKYQPFNFRSTNLTTAPISTQRASHRKGHRYKHSSVSMNLFPEPKQRPPLKINAAYPIPTLSEFLASCTRSQKHKLAWCTFHLAVCAVLFLVGFYCSVHSFQTLSHLVFYDSLTNLSVVCVDIMSNFDVWNKSSIKYPFGLGRLQVLFGFALSISLIFVGCDLISHFIEEFMISLFESNDAGNDHAAHQHSGHNQHSAPGTHTDLGVLCYELLLLLALAITSISSQINAKSKSIIVQHRLQSIIMNNPTNLITLVFTSYLMGSPLMSSLHADFSEVSTLLISVLICYIGWKIVKFLSFIILLSYPESSPNTIARIQHQIVSLTVFKPDYVIKNLTISQIHLKLTIVFLSITMIGGSDDDELNMRYEIMEILKANLSCHNLETTIDIERF